MIKKTIKLTNFNKKFKFKKSFSKPKQWKKIFLITLFLISLFLDILGVFRISWFGQFLDDIFHRFIFGWLKYVYFLFIIFWYYNTITKKGLIAKYWKIINKKKIFWGLFNLFWMVSLISLILINKNISYKDYLYQNFLPKYVEYWKSKSVLEISVKNAQIFFDWNGVFSSQYDGGGIIGMLIAGLSTYTHIIGALTLNLISWVFLGFYLYYNHPFFIFLSSEKKQKFYWNRFNKKKNFYFEPNVISKIDAEQITIQLPIEKKIQSGKKADNKPEAVWDLKDT